MRVGLAGVVRAGLDPCAALQVHVELKPGESKEIFFLMGQGAGRDEAVNLARRYQEPELVETAWNETLAHWDGLLSAVKVTTPDPAMDLMLNRWLMYQALACRMWGRSALYQSSGAYGFRDQLQDAMALVHAAPQIARDHLLRAARHQFEEGDVLHWWHPPSGRGDRTRCSDDLLWLPFVTAHYVEATGDESILSEEIPFLRGAPLAPGEQHRYGLYSSTTETYTLLEHCQRALKKGITSGVHGLPLIGSGDWNDGLSRVGIEGRGESIWLGWFICDTLNRFAGLCERLGSAHDAAEYRERAVRLGSVVESAGWDGTWYRRGYYDDGQSLGSAQNEEWQIDSVAQSWAVLSHAADPLHAEQAMREVQARLVNVKERLILLGTPPFDKTDRDPGYLKGYPPGVRENGGAYGHAAIWTAWACVKLGWAEDALDLFDMLNPVNLANAAGGVSRYRAEPYVLAADLSSGATRAGRAGWTWYTGSAGWMYRLGLEGILGLKRAGSALRFAPCIPGGWRGYQIRYQFGRSEYQIEVTNPEGAGRMVGEVRLDGQLVPDGLVPLRDDGTSHKVTVRMD
jgi:cyclic beta-1,2-glucan synthetase